MNRDRSRSCKNKNIKKEEQKKQSVEEEKTFMCPETFDSKVTNVKSLLDYHMVNTTTNLH